jgi:DNA-binding NtrC family response regulator
MPGEDTHWLSKDAPAFRTYPHVLKQLAEVALTDDDILLVGSESKTKRPYAEFIHQQSRRSKAPFVSVNCTAIKGEPLENVLFADLALAARPFYFRGPIQAAEGGTIFLDEIQALSRPSRVKLLRFMQEKEYRRVGEGRLRRANVRLVAASGSDLPVPVRDRLLSEDVLLHLHVITITVCPLWKRIVVRSRLDQFFTLIFTTWQRFRSHSTKKI